REMPSPPSPLSLHTPIEELYKYRLAHLGQTLAHRLAVEVAHQNSLKDYRAATVAELLNYLPMRYEDRSNPALIRDLTPGMEASLELVVKIAGAYQVKNRRSFSRASLYIF